MGVSACMLAHGSLGVCWGVGWGGSVVFKKKKFKTQEKEYPDAASYTQSPPDHYTRENPHMGLQFFILQPFRGF